MKKHWRAKLIPLFVMVFLVEAPGILPQLPAAAAAKNDSSAQSAAATTGDAAQLVQSYVDDNKFLGSVLLWKKGKMLLDKGFGSANLEWDIPNSPSTKFRLGSVTKQFTAACILLLEERGKLALEDPIRKHLSGLPEQWQKITIFHLLTHSSGIQNFTNFAEYKKLHVFPATAEELIKVFAAKPLEFEPGDKFKYSNSGYILLGAIIEKLSAKSYGQFVHENIFKPLEMNDSGYDSNEAIIKHRACGYQSGANGGFLNAGYVDMTVPFAAGGLYSTVDDMLKWENGLFGGRVLSEKSLAKLTTPYKKNYALGLEIAEATDKKKIYRHSGGIEGFKSAAAYYPDDKIVAVVLSNFEMTSCMDIAGKLADIASGKAAELWRKRVAIALPRATMEKYTGEYKIEEGPDVEIFLDGEKLMSRVKGQDKVQLFPETETLFFLKVVDAQFEFIKEGDGPAGRLLLHQGGKAWKGTRKSR